MNKEETSKDKTNKNEINKAEMDKPETFEAEMSKKKNWKKIILIAAAVLAAAFGIVYFAFQHYYGYSMFVRDDDVELNYELLSADDAILKGYEGELESELDTSQIKKISEEEAAGTYNLLLLGVDRRDDDWYGNSDSIILVTVNHDTQQIFLTSFMRDLYAEIPDYGVMKLNVAHAVGGGPLIVETLENTYGVAIDNYARVDFNSMTDIIDALGGVDIEMSDEEAASANKSIKEMCKLQGKKYKKNKLKSGGKLHLNGIQAVAYSRIRKVGNSDYERTERQRKVLTEMIKNAKSLKFREISQLLNQVLPLITHNVDQLTMVELIAKLPEMMNYEIVTQRVPFDGMYHSQGEMLVPDLAETAAKLQESLYGGKVNE